VIKSCISPDCYEYATDPSQLCEKHLQEHIKRCRLLKDYSKEEVNGGNTDE